MAFNASTSFTSQYWFAAIQNAQLYRQPSFTHPGTDLTYTRLSGKYSVQASVKNIEIRVEITEFNGPPFMMNNGNAAISEPREFGMRFVDKF